MMKLQMKDLSRGRSTHDELTMHENSTDCVLVTRDEDALALFDSFWDNSLSVKRDRTLHAVPKRFMLRELSMDLKFPCLDAAIDCLRK